MSWSKFRVAKRVERFLNSERVLRQVTGGDCRFVCPKVRGFVSNTQTPTFGGNITKGLSEGLEFCIWCKELAGIEERGRCPCFHYGTFSMARQIALSEVALFMEATRLQRANEPS